MGLPFTVTPLPRTIVALSTLEDDDLREQIRARRDGARWHAAQQGDDGCFVDDRPLFSFLDDTVLSPIPESMEERMSLCRLYYDHVNAEAADPLPPNYRVIPPEKRDLDLYSLEKHVLVRELWGIQTAIAKMREITDRPRVPADYRAFYALVVPEPLALDFRRPPREEFLAEGKPLCSPEQAKGCHLFWLSHEGHDTNLCNFSEWGFECPGKRS